MAEQYKPNCCTECTFADECFSEARIKCADYEIAIKEYDRGLADGLKVGCVKGRELEKEIAELKAQLEKMKICASSWIMSLEDVRASKVNDRRGEVLRELEKRVNECNKWELAE